MHGAIRISRRECLDFCHSRALKRGNGLLRGLERAQLGGNQIMNRRIGQPTEVSPALEKGQAALAESLLKPGDIIG